MQAIAGVEGEVKERVQASKCVQIEHAHSNSFNSLVEVCANSPSTGRRILLLRYAITVS